jgi:5-(carboxyamino)imidazole ribonucleotide mutase
VSTAEPDPTTETLTAIEAATEEAPRVGILMASRSDMDVMAAAEKVLLERGVRAEVRVLSVHGDPDGVADYCRTARQRGLKVLIAGAGLSAALPGMAAAHTDLPVVGVPLSSPGSVAGGLDALLSVVQTPSGVPVATVGLDNARNAGHLALRILFA